MRRLLPLALAACAAPSGDDADDTTPRDTDDDPGVTSCAPVPLDGEGELAPGRAAALQAALDDARTGNGAPGAVAAVRWPSGATWVGTAGVREPGAAAPPGDHEAMGWGSITKTMVTVLVLQLADEGALSLDDTVDAWYPGLPGATVIRIRDLLGHTSGLHDYTDTAVFVAALLDDDPVGWAPDEILALTADEGLDFAPGSAWAYSNTNFHAAGRIAERVTGAALADLLDLRVRRRAGLERTWLRGYEDMPPCAPVAPGHLGGLPDRPLDPGWSWAAGGLFSDVRDLLRWGVALLEEPAWSAYRERMTVPVSVPTVGGGTAPYGLGLYLTDNACGRIQGHTGSTMGYQSDLFRTADGIVIGVLQNDFAAEATSLAEALCVAAREGEP